MRRAGGQCERLRRDDGKRCPQPATDVDHIKPGDDHSDTNLAALCTWHHKQKTDLEGGTASAIARKARELADAPKHPGMI
ncbi:MULTISPECIES: HNH endonuclease [unclassified Pseudoclavibacter]|uniref:HNH endonuclease n=1 Tax=unclassified Pseudoclavibacter TaxID=2615177 RepID=UPI001BA99E03|nr:HNH endonuclease signature motif containing protein [Pseudoclavibacter sp. Marseille-Q4354]MBS3177741.1 HNH endonuclease [Pseudoclavibacter sp. Marseille-Q4354]